MAEEQKNTDQTVTVQAESEQAQDQIENEQSDLSREPDQTENAQNDQGREPDRRTAQPQSAQSDSEKKRGTEGPLLPHPFLSEELEALRRELEEAESKPHVPLRKKAGARAGARAPHARKVPGARERGTQNSQVQRKAAGSYRKLGEPGKSGGPDGLTLFGYDFPKDVLKKAGLIGGGIALLAVLGFGISLFAKNRIAAAMDSRMATASTVSTASAADARALSAEEEAALLRAQAVDAELATYQNLGVVDASGYINLRSQPDSVDMTNIIGKLSGGAACDIVQTEGDWSLIQSGGIQGYVYNQYVKTGEEARTLAQEEIGERAVIGADVLNIRSAPEVNAENVIGKARKNERYEVISVDGNWAKIKADFTDTVDAAYINIADGNAQIRLCLDAARKLDLREMALTQYDNIVVSNTDGYVNIRETPDTSSIDNICGKFPAYAGAELLETTEADGRTWYKIKSGNVTGYVSSEYCATGDAAKQIALDGAVLTAFVRTDALNVRSEPSTEASAWTQVTKNQAYHVLNQMDGWVEIELDSSDGEEESDRAFVSTRDNNVEIRYGLPEAVEYYPAVEAANAAMAFRNQIVNYACQFVGNPYVWGGTSLTNGADCSGFTMKVLEHFGISIPRVSRDQARSGVRVTSDQMKPGDLVFYANSSGTVNHVGMYIGNGQVVNAASRRSGIRIYRWNYRTPVAIRNVIGA